jgi:hypothetical protein
VEQDYSRGWDQQAISDYCLTNSICDLSTDRNRRQVSQPHRPGLD